MRPFQSCCKSSAVPPTGPHLVGANGKRIPNWGLRRTVYFSGHNFVFDFLLAAVATPILVMYFPARFELSIIPAKQQVLHKAAPSPRQVPLTTTTSGPGETLHPRRGISRLGESRYYSPLNAVTIPDRYPLPNMQSLNERMAGCTVCSKIDLFKAYHQIPIAEEDIPKTAIATPFGLWEFLFMAFSLRNAAQALQRLLMGLDYVFSFLDDDGVFRKSRE